MTGASAESELPSWHDNLIYRLQFDAGDSTAGDWRSDLVLDIDHIVAWICGNDGRPMFRVAPARLVFHDVTDLHLAIDFTGDSYPRNLAELSIADISREAAAPRGGNPSRPYYRWRIGLNLPKGEITFGAASFTQTLLADPVLAPQPRLAPEQRRRWL